MFPHPITRTHTYTHMYWLVAMAFGNGCVIRLYKSTTTLQPKVPGFVWCDLSQRLFPKAMDNQPEKYSILTYLEDMTADSTLSRPISVLLVPCFTGVDSSELWTKLNEYQV